jgi:hypothetical protein
MFNSDILETAAGIVLVFVVMSTICSVAREALEACLKTRASYLELGIRELLQDRDGGGLVAQLFAHPQVYGLFKGDYVARPGGRTIWRRGLNLPSYIPSRNFALALMDIAAHGPPPSPGAISSSSGSPAPFFSLARVRAGVATIKTAAVRNALVQAIDMADGDLNRARANIEAWYDSSMERVSGWYRRSTQWVLFWIALAVAIGLNVNTFRIADEFYSHTSVRNAAISMIGTTDKSADKLALQDMQSLDALHLPIGWISHEGAKPKSAGLWPWLWLWQFVLQPLPGWLITALAATLGAPFWFDVLDKIMIVRSTVKPARKSGDTVSGGGEIYAPVMAAHEPDVDSSDHDCGAGSGAPTPDELLPAARGGVA